MTKKAGAAILLLSLLVILGVPLFANAANATGIPYWGAGGLISCTGNGANGTTMCSSLCNLIQTFANIIYFIITVCLFVLAPGAFAIGGVMIMLGGANPEMLSKGKSVLLGAVIGVAIVLCSFLLVFTFVKIFNTKSGIGAVFTNNIACTPQ